MSYKVAVVGATGNVGREMLSILAERNFPVSEVVALASRDSLGKEVSFGEEEVLTVKSLDSYDFSGTDIALFSAGGEISKRFVPKAAEAGCIVIDNSSAFRMDKDVPLIVPEVNLYDLKDYKKRNIIANPNCSTLQMVVALKPLHDLYTIKRVVVSTYQSVSGAGKAAMDELFDQTKKVFVYQDYSPTVLPRQIAFNIIPHIDIFEENLYTREEMKMARETQKILDERIKVSATCVRVPVFVGHSESINVEFEQDIDMEEIMQALDNAEGVVLLGTDEEGPSYSTPIEITREDGVFVSRVRRDNSAKNAINMWVVSDNLRKGAALNAVQIAEHLIRDFI